MERRGREEGGGGREGHRGREEKRGEILSQHRLKEGVVFPVYSAQYVDTYTLI